MELLAEKMLKYDVGARAPAEERIEFDKKKHKVLRG